MMRAAWLTDIHLNFLEPPQIAEFLDGIAAASADVVLIGGDIAEARDLVARLREIETALRRPIHFVLGNHDFYGGSIAGVRAEVAELCAHSRWLHWLPASGTVGLTATACLLGHDGWGDGRVGDFANPDFILNDFFLIKELTTRAIPRSGPANPKTKEAQLQIQRLGDEAARHVAGLLPSALERYRRVIVLTHVPPFKEASWHMGHRSDPEALPFFVCQALGDVLLAAMRDRPDREMTVLCGHTHGSGTARILPNLECLTGGAEYGQPRLQRVLEID